MGAALGVAAIAAQWLVAAQWAPTLAVIVASIIGMLVRTAGRRLHVCAFDRSHSLARAGAALVVLASVVVCSIRGPAPPAGDAPHVRELLGEQGRTPGPVRLVGMVVEPARYRDGSATLIVRAISLGSEDGQPLDGLVRLRIQHCSTRFALGERLAVRASLRQMTNFGNPGEFDWAGWNNRRGVFASAFVWSDRDVVSLGLGEGIGFLMRLRASVAQHANEVGSQGAALVAAVTVGDRGGLTAQTLDAIRDSGLAHALAISGLHIGLLAGAALFLVRRALVGTAYVRAGYDAVVPACLAAGFAVFVYAILGGGGVSVFRAVTMGVATLWVLAMAGRGRPLQTLGLAAAALSISSPGVATEPGFQLSFAATGALVALAVRRPSGPMALVAVPLLAWAVTTPIVAQHFQRISLVAPLVNLVAAPLVSATVLVGLAAVALMSVSNAPAALLFRLAAYCASGVLELCDFAAALPAATLDVVSPGAALTFLLAGVPIVALLGGGLRRVLLPVALAGILAFGGFAALERYHGDRLDVHFVSVGQGDATIVKLPGGAVAVVDGGRPGRGRLAIGPWLGRLQIRRIDYLVATHAQADHWGGLAELAEHFEIGEFWHNGGVCDVEAYLLFVGGLRARGVKVIDVAATVDRRGIGPRRVAPSGATISALAPQEVLGPCESNDRSVVLSVRHDGFGLLLGGDIEAAAERHLSGQGERLRHSVLKAPHHGSRTSSTERFLNAVEPWLAVASCGAGNRYGFPHEAVVSRYRDRGTLFLSTDRHGAISLRVDGSGTRVRTAKKL